MPRFNIGDRVKVVKDTFYGDMNVYVGGTYEIERLTHMDNYILKGVTRPNGSAAVWYESELEKQKEEQKMFTKDQLKTGMLVQHKNNEWSVVMLGVEHGYDAKDILLNTNDGLRYRRLSDYNDNLKRTWDNSGDIVKVATVGYIGDIFRTYKSSKSVESIEGFKIIYDKTKDETKDKLQKTIDTLRTQLKQAQEELAQCQ